VRQDKIDNTPLEEELRLSYIDYAMSVIVGRALPDVRDGLKPVHRRILYAMYERGWLSDKPYVKSAKIVGEVIGNYHPHGDKAVYDALVRMAQEFSMRLPLIDGQGNFGSIDGDPPAAYRYTEARLSKFALLLLRDIEKETVDFIPNFDDTRKEPTVLPALLPNLLINGSSGIAVGVSTNIPPHNPNDVINAIVKMIENPEIDEQELINTIKGPDFPTGGIIVGRKGIEDIYLKGRGIIKVRAKMDIEENDGKKAIVIQEIPYQVNKSDLIMKIAKLVNDKIIEGISDIRDESDREGIRIVLELRRDTNENIILNQLIKYTDLEKNIAVIMLALVDNEPKILTLQEIIKLFISHRREVVVRRTRYELEKAKQKAHLLEGIIIAITNIDEVIEIIKKSRDTNEAREKLIERFDFTEKQANAVLDTKLQKLTSLEIEKLKKELEELRKLIKELTELLSSENLILKKIKEELLEIKPIIFTERKTIFKEADKRADLSPENYIIEKDILILISQNDYIKQIPADTFKRQKRGGKGVISSEIEKDGGIKFAEYCKNLSYIAFFSNKGKVFWVKAYELPEGGKQTKGKPIRTLLKLTKEEKLQSIIPFDEFNEKYHFIFLTKKGLIKRMPITHIINAKKNGIFAIKLSDDDELIATILIEDKEDIVIATKQGQVIRFSSENIRPMGRTAGGITGIRLRENDFATDITTISENTKNILTITEKGYGKLVKATEIPKKNRGGMGVILAKIDEKTGYIQKILPVDDINNDIIIFSSSMAIRMQISEISIQGRQAKGVKIISLKNNDKVITAITI
jgi:DNA gyrase subunit A